MKENVDFARYALNDCLDDENARQLTISDKTMDLIHDTGSMVVHNPESNMGNACGCPPTMAIFHKGITHIRDGASRFWKNINGNSAYLLRTSAATANGLQN